MTKRKLKQCLREAARRETPDVLEKVLSATPLQWEAAKEFSFEPPARRRQPVLRTAACALAAVAAVFTGVFASFEAPRVESIVSLDVNPSFELAVDGGERVLECRAVNEDAARVLEGVTLRNEPLDEAASAIISAVREHGYLEEDAPAANTILVSVANADGNKADALKTRVSACVSTALRDNRIEARVIQQSETSLTPEVQRFAEEKGISIGKADLLWKLSEKDGELDPESLSSLSIGEISNMIQEKDIDVSDVLTEYRPEGEAPPSSSGAESKPPAQEPGSSAPSSSEGAGSSSGLPSEPEQEPESSVSTPERGPSLLEGYCEYCGKPNAECQGSCSHKYGKLYCAVCGNRLLLCTCHNGAPAEGYCAYCGEPLAECGGRCDQSAGKRYCETCGKLYSECQCQDSGPVSGPESVPEESGASSQEPYFGPHNPGRYCEYCGELNARCKGTCDTAGGRVYCRNCGGLLGQCECSSSGEGSRVEFGDFPPVDDANG